MEFNKKREFGQVWNPRKDRIQTGKEFRKKENSGNRTWESVEFKQVKSSGKKNSGKYRTRESRNSSIRENVLHKSGRGG